MKTFLVKTLFLLILFSNSLLHAEINIEAKTAILQDFLSGKILYEKDPETIIYPASMTKIMTVIVAFDLLKNGEISLNDKFLISKKAWRLSSTNSSSMFIMVDDEIYVEDLLRGIIIVSGNDACVALAEGISGSEEEFVILMNAKAREIGMQNTNFANSHGLNVPPSANVSTVKDILLMSNYLIKHYPEYYSYFREKEFSWYRTGGDPITQPNTNSLITKNIGVDGIKTGFLTVEKYSLASSILRNDRRLIAVVSGFQSKRSRVNESKKILTYGLTNFDTVEISKKNEKFLSLDTWLGKKEKIDIYIKDDVYITVPKRKRNSISAYIQYNGPIPAPIEKDVRLGVLNIFINNELFVQHDVFSMEKINKVNIFSRLIRSFNFFLWGDV
jgi:D-alanyl-D-alanine carboxypeptidase (penicillin-binding protein 5/6)|tara:strand:+ start:1162 stop:2322 length:1161 start_codon:yes stop_codon:yes gene_type:complete